MSITLSSAITPPARTKVRMKSITKNAAATEDSDIRYVIVLEYLDASDNVVDKGVLDIPVSETAAVTAIEAAETSVEIALSSLLGG